MEKYEYKSNSYASKANGQETTPDEKKVEKVVQGDVKTKKKNEFSKFASEFISEDVKNVKTYIIKDVLIPAIKKGLYDIVTTGFDMLLYGGNGGRRSSSGASKISYTKYYDRRDDNHRSSVDRESRGTLDYDDIVLTDRRDAEEVLIRMNEIIDRYDIVTVADLFELVGEKCPYTAHKYGWTSLRTAEVQRVRDGYLLKLPRASSID